MYDKYKHGFRKLLILGGRLLHALKNQKPRIRRIEYKPSDLEDIYNPSKGPTTLTDYRFSELFSAKYHDWYTEAHELIKNVLPDRLADFVEHYKAKGERISDIMRKKEDYIPVSTHKLLLNCYEQQYLIIKSLQNVFESSLLNLRGLLLADVFDSELETAQHLFDKGFIRASGAVCGVVLENHMKEVVKRHAIKGMKKNPSLNEYTSTLYSAGIIQVPTMRLLQRLSDIRNICDHAKEQEPTKEEVQELVIQTGIVLKNLN